MTRKNEVYFLYRHFDSDKKLLYVGISCKVLLRTFLHQNRAKWFEQISMITLEKFSSKKEAKLAEASAIMTENPIYNILHKNKPIEKSRIFISKGALKLAEYMRKKGITQAEMASLLGVSQQAVDKYVNCGVVPRKAVMERIVESTHNKVRPQDFKESIFLIEEKNKGDMVGDVIFADIK